MTTLLPFHRSILERIHDPSTNDLLILARGLGLRRIICTLMKIYDSPQSLVLLVNASQEEEFAFGEQLSLMGCRKPGLRIVGYEINNKERQELYKTGGLISVTSRILVVDMLQSEIPTHLITGIIVLHAERVTALSLEAFIVRLYREKNSHGFLKAFTDQPEHITSGMSPLRNIMKELQLRTVHIYPRFHEDIKRSLERRKADVVELQQPLTDSMADIHQALVQCMNSTLGELKRSNTTLELDDLNIESAYFRSFESVVRRQLDPVWHKVGPRTKQLVSDLSTLRQLLIYLLTYDPFKFYSYLETIIASNSVSASGGVRQHQSQWLFTDAANTIYQVAKRRCYTVSSTTKIGAPPPVIDLVGGDDDEWAALDEIEDNGQQVPLSSGAERRPSWLPEGIEPMLEELPKWTLLAEVMKEIEEEIMRQESLGVSQLAVNPGSNVVLIVTSSTYASKLIGEFLSTMDPDAPRGRQGRKLMLQKLRLYLWWKSKLSERKRDEKPQAMPESLHASSDGSKKPTGGSEGLSEAMKKKDREKAERLARRRRMRGAPPVVASGSQRPIAVKIEDQDSVPGAGEMMMEADKIAQFTEAHIAAAGNDLVTFTDVSVGFTENMSLDLISEAFGNQFDMHYGLLAPAQTVLVRAYTDDSDDQVLFEIKPKFIVMFEPNMEFIRRIEVYRSSNPGLGIRVYHMVYHNCCEEHKYLAGIRREKESFERLIKERGSMLMPIIQENSTGTRLGDAVIKTISSRIAGGRRELNTEPSRVVVDLREFRSTLPSLLHASKLLVFPATLTVGDYIITPDICIERKSVPDLISSFNSGRLFTQCELMSVHYKQPILLIEFEDDKAFSLETVGELKSYAKPTGKYPSKKKSTVEDDNASALTLQSKIVLLTLTFPRVRIIWSSSPYATADIFNDLKMNSPEPDPVKAIAVGAEGDPEAGAGVNSAAEELLQCLPGISTKNVKYVMSKVKNVRELCEMDLAQVQAILGVEPGKACWEFMHRGDRKR